MIARVTRLVRAEFLKLFSNPFFYVTLVTLAAAVILAQYVQPKFSGQKETVWRSFHAIQLFAYGFKFGLKIATFFIIVFAAMMFAGEFDRGTIKNLLTRPVTRTDFFAAKCVTVLGLVLILYLFILCVSWAGALARGDLGPVWDDEQYLVHRSADEIAGHAEKAILMSFPPFLTAAFLGLLVSNWTESSGYAVAIALVLYLLADFFVGMLGVHAQRQTFFYYAPYALEKLKDYAEGRSALWNSEIDKGLLYLKVPLIYVAAFLPPAYVVFRFRDIRS